MKRRGFLKSGAAAVLLSGNLPKPAAALEGPTPVAIVITDVSAHTSLRPLRRVATAFLERGIPLTCCVSLPDSEALDNKMREALEALTRLTGGLDLAIHVPDLQTLSPYFQSRAVFEARKRLIRLAGRQAQPLLLETVICEETKTPKEPTGVRASAFRNVLVRPAEDRLVSSETWPNGVVRFFGGQTIKPGPGLAVSTSPIGAENRSIFYLSANILTHVGEEMVVTWATGLVENLQQREFGGQLALMSVPDMQLRDNFELKRSITILLDLPEGASDVNRQRCLDFQAMLEKDSIHSILKPPGKEFWAQKLKFGSALISVRPQCQVGKSMRLIPTSPIARGFGLGFIAPQSGEYGIDGCAILRVPMFDMPQPVSPRILEKLLVGAGDIVLSISPDQLATPAARRAAASSVHALREDGITRFDGIFGFARSLTPDGHIEERYRRTVQFRANAGLAVPATLDDAAGVSLLADAKHAWAFFEKYTDGITGLAPAAIDTRPGGRPHQAVTMWDVGSNINALVAATRIGLIDEKQLAKRINRILPNITGRRTQGRVLPQGWIRTDRFHWGNWNFDGCDAGRLLSALDNLRRSYGMDDALDKLVGAWDLKDVVIDRKIHSVTGRELVSTYQSHCAHYAALAFRRWGLDVASPYETFANLPSADGEVMLLETVAGIGPLGAEPLLLEAIELGMSQESAFLADLLFSAQQEEFEETGRLLCVSETAIDQSPWFIYQGLQLGIGPREWRLDTVGHQPQYLTEDAAKTHLAFSAKAAFLWSAYRGSDFSDRLLSFAREKATNDVGFASSVNLGSLRKTESYSDLNTNAVILQAIAHLLRDR